MAIFLVKCLDEGVTMSAAATYAFDRIHMYFAKNVAIFVASILSAPMIDSLMLKKPCFQA